MSQTDGPVTSKVEAVMARIRASASANRDDGDGSTRLTVPPPSDASVFGADVYRGLHQARTIGGGIGVTFELGWRTPIIGQAWMLVRQRIHQEIRMYIDALTSQQTNFNTHFLRALTGVVEGVDSLGLRALRRQQQEHADALRLLQTEVSELQSEIQALRAGQPSSNLPRSDDEPVSRV